MRLLYLEDYQGLKNCSSLKRTSRTQILRPFLTLISIRALIKERELFELRKRFSSPSQDLFQEWVKWEGINFTYL